MSTNGKTLKFRAAKLKGFTVLTYVRQITIYYTKFQYRHSSKPGKRGMTKNVIY